MKGRDCHHALSFFRDSRRLWAETKYDGERAQIHVEIMPNIKPRITIFSKSKRNSTLDRRAIHDPILEALNLYHSEGHEPKLKKNVILDAEMVACHGTDIDGSSV
jgi:DNA ligase 4